MSIHVFTARNSSCGKVMFSQVSVYPQGAGVSARGAPPRQPLKWAVCILLECILVMLMWKLLDFYCPETKFGARWCFHRCLSVGGGGLASQHSSQVTWAASRWGCSSREFASREGVGHTFPTGTRKTGGTHPTGMLSCFAVCLVPQTDQKWVV